jgi:enoyl-CoA hydratase
MAYETILYEVRDAVAVVVINRPKVMNALNPQVIEELAQAFAAIAADDQVKAVVLTGAGDRAFVAGADIAAMAEMPALEGRKFARRGQEVLFMIEKLDKPVIAAVGGFALGGGTEISMACDFVYASSKAKFGQPEINLGIIPGFGGTQRLARLVGRNRAKELCLTGEIICAEERIAPRNGYRELEAQPAMMTP